jgi:hypothetical protein
VFLGIIRCKKTNIPRPKGSHRTPAARLETAFLQSRFSILSLFKRGETSFGKKAGMRFKNKKCRGAVSLSGIFYRFK